MFVPGILFFLSLIGMAATWTWPDVFLLACLCAVASAALLLQALRDRLKRRETAKRWVVIDGSNVMYWDGGVPRLDTLRQVVARLQADGFVPGVMFDANAGYLLTGRYMRDTELGQALRLPVDRVMVVPKGVPADPYILNAARDLKARIVTNDQYRDWISDFPEIADEGFLVKGGYRKGALWLELAA